MLENFKIISNDVNNKDIVFIAIAGENIENLHVIKDFFKNSTYHLVVLNHDRYRDNMLLFSQLVAAEINYIINSRSEIIYSKFHYFSKDEFIDYKYRISTLTED